MKVKRYWPAFDDAITLALQKYKLSPEVQVKLDLWLAKKKIKTPTP